MNTKYYDYVLAVAREGSITAASKKLFISQPALSQMIKQLETEIGSPVFDRSTSPLSLTYVGLLYINAAQQIIDIDRNLRATIAEAKNEVHARLRIGISTMRGLQILPLVIPEFHRLFPHVVIETIDAGSADLEVKVADGACDFAMVTTEAQPHHLHYILIENEHIVLLASNQANIARQFPDGTPIDISSARNESFVCMKPGHSVRELQDELFERHHIKPQILLETGNMEAAKRVTARAGAVMMIPYVYVRHFSEPGYEISQYPIANLMSGRHFYLCFRPGMKLTNYMETFIRLVCRELDVPFRLDSDIVL